MGNSGTNPISSTVALLTDPLTFFQRVAAPPNSVVELHVPFVRAFLLLDPADIETVLTATGDEFIKPIWLRTPAVRRLLGDGLVTAEGDEWREQRRACQPAFHGRMMAEYGRIIDDAAERVISEWQPNTSFDLLHAMTDLTMRIVGQAMFGDSMDSERDRIGHNMDRLMRAFRAPYKAFGLAPFPALLSERRAGRELNRLIAQVVDRAAKARRVDQTLLGLLLEFDPDNVIEQAKTFITAGHESSALALTWLLSSLAKAPDVEREIVGELGDGEVTGKAVDEMPHLQAAIKETLRLYPPLWMTGRQTTRPVTIGGVDIPGGSQLLTCQWAVQRSERYYQRPHDFYPGRWLSPEIDSLPRFAYFPFGGGARGCIGQRFAMLELGIVAATILRRYRVAISCPGPLRPWATMTLRPPVGITATVERR